MAELISLLFLCYAALFACIVVRAAVQAFAGRLLGFSIHKVRVGSGDWKWRTSIASIPWDWRPFPFGGGAELRTMAASGLRWKIVALTLSVLTAEGLMLWALVRVWPSPQESAIQGEDDPATAFLVFMLFIRGLNILCDLLPTTVTVSGLRMPTDGMLLQEYLSPTYPGPWARVFKSRDRYEKNMARYQPGFEIESSFLIRPTDTDEVRALHDSANQDADNGLYETAIEKFEWFLKRSTISGGERARVLDYMACIPVMHGHEVAWEKVLGWLREAQTLAPKSITVRGTLGGALVQSGSYAEAIEILTPLTTPENDEVDRTISSIYLAKAWDRQGDHAQAAQWMTKVLESGGFADIRNRILAELSPDTKARLL